MGHYFLEIQHENTQTRENKWQKIKKTQGPKNTRQKTRTREHQIKRTSSSVRGGHRISARGGGGGRDFLGTKLIEELGADLKKRSKLKKKGTKFKKKGTKLQKKKQNSRRKGTKLKKKVQNSQISLLKRDELPPLWPAPGSVTIRS